MEQIEGPHDDIEQIVEFAARSTIDKSSIIHHIITLLPKEFQDKQDELMQIDAQTFSDQISLQDAKSIVTLNNNENEEGIMDPEELQRVNSGCILWDLSSVEEHAVFIHQHHIIPIINRIVQEYNYTEAGKKAHTERLLEICVGILANLCSVESICASIFADESMVASLETLFLMTSDTRILHELLRLYIAAASYAPNESNTSNYLLKFLMADSDQVLPHLLVILTNTMNDPILEKAAQLVLHILYQVQEELLQKMLLKNLLQIVAVRMTECSSPNSPLRSELLTEIFIRICESAVCFAAVVSHQSFHPQLLQILASLLNLLKQWRDSEQIISMCAVVLSNVISENADLSVSSTTLLINESVRLKTLLSILPVSESLTSTAIWSILSHVLINLRKEFDCSDFNTEVHNTLQLIANSISVLLDQASSDLQENNENQDAIQFTLKLLSNTLQELKETQKLELNASAQKLEDVCTSLASNGNTTK